MPIRVMLVDDHPIVLQGLQHLFTAQPDFTVVASCETIESALQAVSTAHPDVIVLDLKMGNENGLSLLEQLEVRGTPCRTVVLTATLSDEHAAGVLRRANGLVLKESAPAELLDVVRRVHAGESCFDPQLLGRALARAERGSRAATLTTRERDVVKMVAGGLRNRDIADKLCISESTVKVHLHNIYEKLGVEGRMELLLFAQDAGLD